MSLRARAMLAVALTIGFYVLAIGLIAVLVRIVFIPNVPGRVLAFCIVGAGAIAISIIPRPSRFVAPGPRLNPAGQPRLFAELEGVAEAVGEAMPEEVYVTPEMNAGVLQRGRRRVMVLGLPLMQVMTVSQMRAVLAHEFGHYYGGDTRLGPWIYRTRETIERTLSGLSRTSSFLQLPFLWYGRLFLRVTQAVSRQQELAADALAARTIGAAPMMDGLRALARGSIAFGAYWQQEVVPLLEAGFQPPVTDGFSRFLAEPEMMQKVAEAAEAELAKAKPNPYDSHPPDAERIAALAAMPPGPSQTDGAAAASLVDGLEVIDSVLLIGLPKLVKYADRLGQSEAGAAGRSVSPDRARSLGIGLAGSAFAVALANSGWSAESMPGRPVVMRRGDATLEPFGEVSRLASGEVDVTAWQQRCWDLGIRDVSLAPG